MTRIFSRIPVRWTLALSVGVLFLIQSSAPSDTRKFRAAFPLDSLRSVTQGDAKVATEILIRKIVEEQGFEYTTSIPETHAELIPEMKKNNYDFFLIFGYEFLKYRDQYELEPVLVGARTAESPLNTFVLVTKKDAGIQAAKDGVLLVQQGSGLLPHIWLTGRMEEDGLGHPEQYFGEIREVGSVSQAVLPVFFGKAQAGLITREGLEILAELNPQINQMLEKTYISEPLLTTLMCVRKGYPKDDTEVIVRIAKSLHTRPDGDQALTMMRVEKLVPFETEYMVSLEKLVQSENSDSSTKISAPAAEE